MHRGVFASKPYGGGDGPEEMKVMLTLETDIPEHVVFITFIRKLEKMIEEEIGNNYVSLLKPSTTAEEEFVIYLKLNKTYEGVLLTKLENFPTKYLNVGMNISGTISLKELGRFGGSETAQYVKRASKLVCVSIMETHHEADGETFSDTSEGTDIMHTIARKRSAEETESNPLGKNGRKIMLWESRLVGDVQSAE